MFLIESGYEIFILIGNPSVQQKSYISSFLMKFSDLKSNILCVVFIGPDLREKPCLTELLQITIIAFSHMVNQDDEQVEQGDEEE